MGGIVTAVARVAAVAQDQSLAQELLRAMGAAKKETRILVKMWYKISLILL